MLIQNPLDCTVFCMFIIVEYLIAVVVEVQYDCDAEESDELTIRVGDIIRNCEPVEEGWMVGELNGKRGVFPENYVLKKETIPNIFSGNSVPKIKTAPPLPGNSYVYVCGCVHVHKYI